MFLFRHKDAAILLRQCETSVTILLHSVLRHASFEVHVFRNLFLREGKVSADCFGANRTRGVGKGGVDDDNFLHNECEFQTYIYNKVGNQDVSLQTKLPNISVF